MEYFIKLLYSDKSTLARALRVEFEHKVKNVQRNTVKRHLKAVNKNSDEYIFLMKLLGELR